jgi:hypothetical protein
MKRPSPQNMNARLDCGAAAKSAQAPLPQINLQTF